MNEQTRTLSDEEKDDLRQVLIRDEPVSVLLHGDGADRTLSLYAEGTRLEARIAYPEPS